MIRRQRYSGSRDGSNGNRKGVVLPLFALMLLVLCGIVALAVDTGALACYRGQAQNSADAAALAAAWEMASAKYIYSDSTVKQAASYAEAVSYAAKNQVGNDAPLLPPDHFAVGTLSDPHNPAEVMNFVNPDEFNSVQVTVSQDVPLFFAAVFGLRQSTVETQATASFFSRNTVGFKITDKTGASSLMPFAVDKDEFKKMFDPGAAREMSMFPVTITSGNFGTVEIGDWDSGANDLKSQITKGPTQADLDYHGPDGLVLDPLTGALILDGDPGVSASIKAPVEDVIAAGLPRTILLYDKVSDPGATSKFRIVGFAGVRIKSAKLTGSKKEIVIEPAVVADNTAVSGNLGPTSYLVGPPVMLVR